MRFSPQTRGTTAPPNKRRNSLKVLSAVCLCLLAGGIYFNMSTSLVYQGSSANMFHNFFVLPNHFQEENVKENQSSTAANRVNKSFEIVHQETVEPSSPPPVWEEQSPTVERRCLQHPLLVRDVREEFPEEDPDFLKTDEGKEFKTILVWNYAYGSTNLGFGYGHKPFKKACCKESRCFLSGDRRKMPIKDYDALIFHFRSLNLKELPTQRSEDQKWIFLEQESPDYSYQNPSKYNGLFNWTMTYRRDSDIYFGYGVTYPRSFVWNETEAVDHKPIKKSISKDARDRPVIAAWLVSHCITQSYRENYAKELQKYVGVDIYGKCGELKCPSGQGSKCYEMIEKKYKFYLSFENSLCKDYTTEKFFNILNYDVVPVVLGMGDYKSVAPPNSFIDIFDFPTVKKLANYLIYLDRNDTAYREYFRWKQDYEVFNGHGGWGVRGLYFCRLCQRLHSMSSKKTYHNLRQWFMEDANCKRIRPLTWLERILKLRLE